MTTIGPFRELTAEHIAEISARNRASRRAGIQSPPAARERARRAPRQTSAMPRASEHQEQVAVIRWWDMWAFTNGIDHRLLFANPNAGAGASKGQAGKMRAEGARAGVPDLFLALPRAGSHGLFLEMKAWTGRTPPAQRAYHELLLAQGYSVIVAHGAAAACRAIIEYVGRASGKP